MLATILFLKLGRYKVYLKSETILSFYHTTQCVVLNAFSEIVCVVRLKGSSYNNSTSETKLYSKMVLDLRMAILELLKNLCINISLLFN